ncbi:MAG: acetate--CoA ligase family protein, partial [Proteobacteria bacterium]|nr:acetate--CoA ligase family protein [Pseudomonadota bacterium]
MDTARDTESPEAVPAWPDLTRLLAPRHIAVIGGREAAIVVRQCRAGGFSGPIWPVNPARAEIEGVACYDSVAALPEAPDLCFIAVPRGATVEVVRELANRGAGGAVCYAAGFAEVGREGAELQRALVAAAGAMPLVGPNCFGLLNYLDGAALWPDQHGGEAVSRGVAIVTQSGNIGINLTMQARSLPIAYVISIGNQAALGFADYIA